eukprot:TRINITY_DN53151_c0_g1_i4.p1 TRINITY_DN53151_c0_g1~~TRINITY_DN53151_c0_g1_i4.p1  ORF type:complete len:576 (+),score=55.14 TRINITY_DN53151_c0_g1_i4:267-1994(+)
MLDRREVLSQSALPEDQRHAQRIVQTWALFAAAAGHERLQTFECDNWGWYFCGQLRRLVEAELEVSDAEISQGIGVAAARLLVHPWKYVRGLDSWLTVGWLLLEVSWPQLVRDGWASFFAVLAWQLPSPGGRARILGNWSASGFVAPAPSVRRELCLHGWCCYLCFPPLSALENRSLAELLAGVLQRSFLHWYAVSGCDQGTYCTLSQLVRTIRPHAVWWRIWTLQKDIVDSSDPTFRPHHSWATHDGEPQAAAGKSIMQCSTVVHHSPDCRMWQLRCVQRKQAVAAQLDSILIEPTGTRSSAAKVAVCIVGPLRAVAQRAALKTIRRHVLEALDGDLLAYLSVVAHGEDGRSGALANALTAFWSSFLDGAEGKLHGNARHPGRCMCPDGQSQSAAADWTDRPVGDPLAGSCVRWRAASTTSSRLRPPPLLLAAEQWAVAELAAALNASVWPHYQQLPGNWRAPLFGEVGGNLHMLLQQATCLKMVEAQEERIERPYEHIVFSRSDLHWVAEHPVFHSFAPDQSTGPATHLVAALIPSGEDWWISAPEDECRLGHNSCYSRGRPAKSRRCRIFLK